MKIIKKLPVLMACLTGLALFFAPTKMANGCGPSDYGYYVYSFIEPDIIEAPSFRPFFFTFSLYFDDWQGETFGKNENLKEWDDYFENKVSEDAISEVIYKSTIRDLEGVVSGNLRKAMKENALFVELQKNRNPEFVSYLTFAKRCEPYATGRSFDEWSGESTVDGDYVKQSLALIDNGLKAFKACKSDFLKMRYAFQIVRLSRYIGDWQATVGYYQKLMPQVANVNSIFKYWTMEHYAGALYNQDKRAEAAYLFAQIFDKCPSRRMASYRSFGINSDEEWAEALGFCQNESEQAALYALRAINPINNAAEEMAHIYDLSPNSSQLDLLLLREMQKLEYELLGASLNPQEHHNKLSFYDYETGEEYLVFPREGSLDYLAQLQGLSQKVITEGKVKNLAVWRLASGYLSFLDGKHDAALAVFDALEKEKSHSAAFQQQIKVFKTAVKVDLLTKVDADVEKNAVAYRNLLQNVGREGESGISMQANYLMDKLASIYSKQGEHAKAFLCLQGSFYDLLLHPKLAIIDGLIDLYNKNQAGKLNEFESFMVSKFFYKGKWIEKNDQYILDYSEPEEDIFNMLSELKGTAYLAIREYDKAIAIFEKLPAAYQNSKTPPSYWEENRSTQRFNLSDVNPFDLAIGGYPKAKNPDETFNKLKLAKRLKALEAKVKTESGNTVQNNYELGLVYFNMSYNGSAWRALDYYKTAADFDEMSENVYPDYTKLGNQSFRFNENALVFLNKAIAAASSRADNEWAAKACFVAASCQTRDKANNRNIYLKKLAKTYDDTEFYAQAIRECSVLSNY